MCSTRVLVLLALLVGGAHCFSWDIVVGDEKQLNFYLNGTLTHAEQIPHAAQIRSVTYDPVRFRVLFADKNSKISSFDLSTRKTQHLFTKKTSEDVAVSLAYDPVSQFYSCTMPIGYTRSH
ncbi:hypothetical protein PYW07_007569 [Mythimna separata]|uniref:Uncharacterized protein n=1 Tax=Mythimna separata TaxID=271217 RepID=A0AAD7Z0U6_MYTSE|nr:hypothetical protein PYW07_007569 [Mythimna separata]